MTLLQIPDVPAVLPDSVPDTRNELHMLATLPADVQPSAIAGIS